MSMNSSYRTGALILLALGASTPVPAEASGGIAGIGDGACSKLSIQDAIDEAINTGQSTVYVNSSVGAVNESVVIDAGVHHLTIVAGNDTCTTAFPGNTQPIIWSRSSNPRVIDIISGDVTLRNFTISGGLAPNGEHGGNIRSMSPGTLRLEEVHLKDGHSSESGGGVAIIGEGTLYVGPDSLIADNKADFSGGGIFVDGGTLLLENASVLNNDASESGGGVALIGEGTLYVGPDSLIEGNKADFSGGAIFVDGGTLLLENASVLNNYAGTRGGSVDLQNRANMTAHEATVGYSGVGDSQHQYNAHGGCLHAIDSSVTLQRMAIHNCWAETDPVQFGLAHGGAVYLHDSNMTLLNHVTIRDSWSSGGGGLIFAGGDSGNITATGNGTISLVNGEALGAWGGLIAFASGGVLQLNGVILDNGRAAWGGGAIWAALEDTKVRLGQSTRVTNSHSFDPGGGIHLDKASGFLDGHVVIDQNTTDTYGAGIYLKQASLEITGETWKPAEEPDVPTGGVRIEKNTALSAGGGVFADASRISGSNLIVAQNSAEYAGGGIALHESMAVLFDTVIQDNWSTRRGGGVYIDEGSAFTLSTDICRPMGLPANRYCSEIRGNSAVSGEPLNPALGGGIFTRYGITNLYGVAVIGNEADVLGSALHQFKSDTYLNNVLVEAPQVGSETVWIDGGRAVFNFSTFAGDGLEVWMDGSASGSINNSVFSHTASLLGGSFGGAILGTCNVGGDVHLLAGLLNFTTDPLFVPTPRGRWRLDTNTPSPAIDLCARPLSTVTIDLDGNSRPAGNGYDSGAFEM